VRDALANFWQTAPPVGEGKPFVLVGATGFEPVTSSVSVNAGLPLCNPAFSQVVADRRGQS
jgi:hypothetical protein